MAATCCGVGWTTRGRLRATWTRWRSQTRRPGARSASPRCCIERYMRFRWLIALAAFAIAKGGLVAATHEAPLIQRAALFGNPVRAQARLSPDGHYISFLAPKDGTLNIWLAPYGKLNE